MMRVSMIGLAAAAALAAGPAAAQGDPPAWTRATAPYNVIGPVDYVGTEGLAAYLIRTPAGAILIDAPMEENVDRLKASIAARGVKLSDVKLILLSHAHFDHAGGLAAMKAATGARLVVGSGDRAAVEAGVPPGETNYGVIRFPAAKVDLAAADGAKVSLGGVTLTAVSTSGHTPGCTSWRMTVTDKGQPRDVLFACSVTVAGNRLVGNRRYPGIVDDFRASFAKLGNEKADVVLPFHPEMTDLTARVREGRLVDPALLPRLVREGRTAFETELTKQGG